MKKKAVDLKSLTTEELKSILFNSAGRWHKTPYNFFKLKAEYDDRFPRVEFEIVGPCQEVIDIYFDPGLYEGPAHLFKAEGDLITHVDVNEFMWAVGMSDYFQSEGYVPVSEGSMRLKGGAYGWNEILIAK